MFCRLGTPPIVFKKCTLLRHPTRRDQLNFLNEPAKKGTRLLSHTKQQTYTSFQRSASPSPVTYSRDGTAKGAAYDGVLRTLVVDTVAQARQISERAVIGAKAAQIWATPATPYLYGPVVGEDVVDLVVDDYVTASARVSKKQKRWVHIKAVCLYCNPPPNRMYFSVV
ncbi:hypothetical protein PG985_003525 [Apiospora marii]|uniref:Uncharacterized protein n=1 Tax=Apiospora marii TaxID=335849 RepID=A0ABR1SHT9_9PEZI